MCGWQPVTSKNSDWRFTTTLASSLDSAMAAFEVAKDAKTARPSMRREGIVLSLHGSQKVRRTNDDLSRTKIPITVRLYAYLSHQGLHPWTSVHSRDGHTKNLAEACQLEHCEGVALWQQWF